jgi:hypothetical protein
MAYAYVKHTGMSMTASFGTLANILGPQEITIDQKARPLTKKIDTTTAPATSYENTADPLGGAGSASCTVTIKTLASATDYTDTPPGLTKLAMDYSAALAIVPTVAGEHFDLAAAYLTKRVISPKVREFVPVTVTLASAVSAGAWTVTAEVINEYIHQIHRHEARCQLRQRDHSRYRRGGDRGGWGRTAEADRHDHGTRDGV